MNKQSPLRVLHALGVELAAKLRDGITPAHRAALSGHEAALRDCLAMGVDIATRSMKAPTATDQI